VFGAATFATLYEASNNDAFHINFSQPYFSNAYFYLADRLISYYSEICSLEISSLNAQSVFPNRIQKISRTT